MGLDASVDGGTRIMMDGTISEYTQNWSLSGGTSRNFSSRNPQQELAQARARGASLAEQAVIAREIILSQLQITEGFVGGSVNIPISGRAAQDMRDFFAQAQLLRDDGSIDIDGLDALATPDRTPHQVFQNIPEGLPLPTLDPDALPLTPQGSVLLPDLPRVDQSILDLPANLQPRAPDDLPALPVMDEQGNPVIVDLPGENSGALAYDAHGNPIIIEIPDRVAGEPTRDSEGRPLTLPELSEISRPAYDADGNPIRIDLPER